MRGYILPKDSYKLDSETLQMTLVGCKNCRNTWSEMRMVGPVTINGAYMDYDACDNCYNPEYGSYTKGLNKFLQEIALREKTK